MTLTTARQTFREVVAEVAEKARTKLPQTVNGRIESAVKLVLMHDVMPQPDGSILVGSSSDPLQSYLLVGPACECQDFTRGQAPGGWCQHRIAAGIHKRVGELLPQSPGVETESTPTPDGLGSPESAPTAAGPTNTPPLPEARCSINVRVVVHGREVQITLRGDEEAEVLARLEAVLAQYPLPQPAPQAPTQLSPQQHNAAAMHTRVTDFCPVHNVPMKQTSKDGRSWWSHKTDQGWCKGR